MQFAICHQLDTVPRILASTLCRRENNEYAQVFLNGVEAVFDPCGYEDNRTGAYWAVFIGDADLGAAADDVVDFVLPVRLLWINTPGWQLVEPNTHGGDTQKLQVRSIPNPPLIL
jgi:hypothetical protein